jgi:hypothetical protein
MLCLKLTSFQIDLLERQEKDACVPQGSTFIL